MINPDPDPSLRAPSNHQSHSLMVLPPPGLHCRESFERLRGAFAAGYPLSKYMLKTGKGKENGCEFAKCDKYFLLFLCYYLFAPFQMTNLNKLRVL